MKPALPISADDALAAWIAAVWLRGAVRLGPLFCASIASTLNIGAKLARRPPCASPVVQSPPADSTGNLP